MTEKGVVPFLYLIVFFLILLAVFVSIIATNKGAAESLIRTILGAIGVMPTPG